MARINTFWVVRDPSPVSELADILFATTPEDIGNIAIGTGSAQWKAENPAFYTDEAEALQDAQARLARRDS